MYFEDVERSIMLTMAAGKVPVVVGDKGIGKTAMVRSIAEKLNMLLINIDCNLLKEGEMGGLPIPYKNDNGTMVTDYAIHAKLRKIEDYLTENPDGSVLLFMDEINRTTRETMSELMNLILNREINGYHLNDNVFIVAAMNPSSSTEGFEGNTSYGVTDMDAASKNRLVWLYLELDAKSWLSWATDGPTTAKPVKEAMEEIDLTMYDPTEYKTFIEDSIVEFIASFPNLLNCPREDVDVTPSGRTWQFASDIIRTYNKNKEYFTEMQLEACIRGCIGKEAYTQYMQFVANNDNPLIKPEEFWAGKEVKKELLDKFEVDQLPRQILMAKNIARFLSEKPQLVAADYNKLYSIYSLLSIDTLMMIMRTIKTSYPALNTKLCKNSQYLKLYREAGKLAN